jgi:hypothetical protein
MLCVPKLVIRLVGALVRYAGMRYEVWTDRQFEEQALDEFIIFGENLQDFLVTGQVDQDCQGIFRNGLVEGALVAGRGKMGGGTHGIVLGQELQVPDGK